MAGNIYHSWNGTVLTITSDSGTSSAELRGEDGCRGAQGIPGGTLYNVSVAPRNILDNSNFQIAQAGYNALHGSTMKYVCDRWITWDKDATIGEGYITPQSPIDQRIGLDVIDINKTYTAAIGLADGTIKCDSGTFANSFGSYNIGIYCLAYQTGNSYVGVRLNTGLNIKWVALYEGEYTVDTLPAYQPKPYSAELLECQRYYIKIATQPINGWCYNWGRVSAFVSLPVKMRVPYPTVVLAQETPNFYVNATAYNAALEGSTSVENGVVIYYKHTAAINGQCVIPEFAAEINADL